MSGTAELLARLVEIDSTNPALVPGGAGETEIAAFVAGWLRERGLDATVDEVAPGRANAIATARGSGGGRSLLLCAHMDTVGVEGMAAPFEPRIEAGRMQGRGSFDMKGGLAAVMAAAVTAAEAGLRGDVIVAAVCDEEHESIGAEKVAAELTADAAVVTEPTGLEVCVAHKGFVWLDVETAGVAAHGSRPDLGVDAIAAMGEVLVGLTGLGARLAGSRPHPLLGTGSVHASLIEGGQELSSYPERCLLRIERRTVPGETPGRRRGRDRRDRPGCGRPPDLPARAVRGRTRRAHRRRRPPARGADPRPRAGDDRARGLDGRRRPLGRRDPHRRLRPDRRRRPRGRGMGRARLGRPLRSGAGGRRARVVRLIRRNIGV